MFVVLGTNSISLFQYEVDDYHTSTEFTNSCGEDFLLHLEIQF